MARQWHAENRLYCPSVPACKFAAESASVVAEHMRDAVDRPRYRLVSGSLPYFSGVRTARPHLQHSCRRSGDGNQTRTVSLGMEAMSAPANGEQGPGHPNLTKAVRQGSLTGRSSVRGSAVDVGGSGLLEARDL